MLLRIKIWWHGLESFTILFRGEIPLAGLTSENLAILEDPGQKMWYATTNPAQRSKWDEISLLKGEERRPLEQ